MSDAFDNVDRGSFSRNRSLSVERFVRPSARCRPAQRPPSRTCLTSVAFPASSAPPSSVSIDKAAPDVSRIVWDPHHKMLRDGDGAQYRVVYWSDGRRWQEWMFGWELKAVSKRGTPRMGKGNA